VRRGYTRLGVELPRIPKTDKRYLTHEQAATLTEGCGSEGTNGVADELHRHALR
jgi:hypothetical protein